MLSTDRGYVFIAKNKQCFKFKWFSPGIFLSAESQGTEGIGDFVAMWLAVLNTSARKVPQIVTSR